MSEVAEKAADATAEVVEESIDGIVDVVEVVRSSPKVLIAVGILGAVAGGVGGYFLAKNKLRQQYEDLAQEEIAEAKQFYANLNKVAEDGAILTPQDVMVQRHGAKAASDAVRVYQGVEEPEMRGEPHDEIVDEELLAKTEAKVVRRTVETVEEIQAETDRVNVFVDPTFDLEEELKRRTKDKPYVISHDEFYAAELEYDTVRLTYYELDDVLADEHDSTVTVDEYIGDDNVVRFGHGSKDHNVVYIRNDKRETDYEVARSKGSYLEEVLGMPDEPAGELKHSDERDRRRAFRRGEG